MRQRLDLRHVKIVFNRRAILAFTASDNDQNTFRDKLVHCLDDRRTGAFRLRRDGGF